MQRLTRCLFARPWGPNATVERAQYAFPAITEINMTRINRHPRHLANIAAIFTETHKREAWKKTTHGIPRDFGELPRHYALKMLYANQPCTMHALWDVLSERDDCPFDSLRHARHVLRLAREQNWVQVEKNLANGEWVYSIHRARLPAVRDMVQADAEVERQAAIARRENAGAEAHAVETQQYESRTANINHMQQELISQVVKIKEFDPDLLHSLPFYNPKDGSIDFLWYEKAAAQQDATQSSN